jgi:manganese transport protein
VTYSILMFETGGFRPMELIIGSLVGLIGLCYVVEMFIAPVNWSTAAAHMVLPQMADSEALLLAVGIIGATVMPHAVYLHSALTQDRMPVRDDEERRRGATLFQSGSHRGAHRCWLGQYVHGDHGVERFPCGAQ